MLRLTNKVQVGNYILAGVVSVEIDSSWALLTDSCKIMLPSNIWHQGKFVNLADAELIKKGDPITVELGYDGLNDLVFTGFVDSIQAGSPVTVIGQDYMWLLKKKAQNLSYKKIDLESLLRDLLPAAINFKAVGRSLGQFRITKASPAEVLSELKKSYYLHSWFRGNTLYSGLAYWPETLESHSFSFGVNIIEDGSELTFKKAEDNRIKVRAISMLPDNSKIEVEVGDIEGDVRTLHFYNLAKAELEKIAEESIKTLRYDGYSGSFLTFGQPMVNHGDIVEIEDPKYNRAGQYLVKRVLRTFGAQGYRQKIYLDRKA